MDFVDYSSDSSDEEVLEIVNIVKRPRIFRERKNPFELYSEEQFIERYRLSRKVVSELHERIKRRIAPKCNRSSPISAMNQLLLTLRFLATGSFLILLGDDMLMHKSTASRIVRRVTKVIAELSGEYIRMPAREELREVKRKFYSIAGFPNVIGCVDGTHIRIQSPGGDNSELFRNRKGYFSINVQCICDADLVIRDIDARWQGSVHDSTVFENSLITIKVEERVYDGYLLGDSAYPSKPYLLTPVLNPNSQAEQRYNRSHIRTRNTIERSFGVLKRRFPCLSLGLRLRLETAVIVIVAAAVLNNIALSYGNEIEDNAEMFVDEEQPHNAFDREEDLQGVATRTGVIHAHFRR